VTGVTFEGRSASLLAHGAGNRGTAEAGVATWVAGGLDGLFSFVQGRGEVEEIEFGKIANFADECGQGQFESSEGGVLFWASGGGYQGAQLSHALFQGGGTTL